MERNFEMVLERDYKSEEPEPDEADYLNEKGLDLAADEIGHVEDKSPKIEEAN